MRKVKEGEGTVYERVVVMGYGVPREAVKVREMVKERKGRV